MDLIDPIGVTEERPAAPHGERAEAIDALREQIKALEDREPELRLEIPAFEKAQRTTLAELERTQRATIAELEQAQRARIAELEQAQRAAEEEDTDELEDELERTRTELAEDLKRTRTELAEELARTRAELAEQLAALRAELASIPPALIEARCTLGMKMSDFALDENDGHEHAIEYLQPLLGELQKAYRRAHLEAERTAAEAKETLKTLEADRQDTAEAALPVVEQRFQPLIEAEILAVRIEQTKVRVARHQLALVDADDGEPDDTDPDDAEPDDIDPRLARELELEAALDELDAARAKVSALQEEKQAAEYHYSHPTAEKGKRLAKQFATRFRRQH